MPDRKIVPCSWTYLSRRVVSGRASLTGAPGCAACALVFVSVVAATDHPFPTVVWKPYQLVKTVDRVRLLLGPGGLEAAEVAIHHLGQRVEIAGGHRIARLCVDRDRPLGHE